MSETIFISTLDELYSGLASAKGGEVFALTGGDYGSFSLNLPKTKFNIDLPDVTITSADPDDPASFSRVALHNASGVTFDGLVFDYTFEPGQKEYTRPFKFIDSSNITIRNSVFDGDLAHGTGTSADGFGYGFALSVSKGSGIVIENNEFFNFTRGIMVGSSSGVQVIGNDVHSMRSDGMNFVAVSDVLIEGNHLHDFLRSEKSGDHADFIQFWTTGKSTPTTDVTIRGNILDIGEGGGLQSIFMRNEEVDTGKQSFDAMAYRNILIEDNLITNGHLHGITVGETDGLIIRNNSVLRADGGAANLTGSAVEVPKISVKSTSTNVVIENNITSAISGHDGQPDWVVDHNLLVQDSNPLKPGWYGDVFVNSTLTPEDGAHRFILLPDSDAALKGIGASLSHAATSLQFHVTEGDTAASRIFDAALGMGERLPEGAIVKWDFGDGVQATGPIVEHVFAAGGKYPVTMTVHLPDGTVNSRTSETGIAGSQLVEMGTSGFVTYDRGEAALSGAADFSHGLQLGAPGVSASVSSRHIQPLLRADEFAINLTLTADTIGTSGEVFRIHTGTDASVGSNGEFRISIWNTDGQVTRLTGAGVKVNDGVAHEISIRVIDGQASLIIDGESLSEAGFSGNMRMSGSRNLVFGEPWGKKNFHGDLTDFSITIDESAYTGVSGLDDPDRVEVPPVDTAPDDELPDVLPPGDGETGSELPDDPEIGPEDPDEHGSITPDPSSGGLKALALPLPEEINHEGLQLGEPGVAGSVSYHRLGGLLSSEDFSINLTLAADDPGSSGELFRIHTGITAGVNSTGELTVSMWDDAGAVTRLVTTGAGLGDGAEHDVAIRLEGGRLSLTVDGVTSAEGDFSGMIRTNGTRNLTFGEPWGGKNFQGKLTGFEISVAQPEPVTPDRSEPPADPDTGVDLLDALDLALPEAIGDGGLKLGARGAADKIGHGQLTDLLASDDFRIDLTLAASEFGSAGEVFRIHTGMVASVSVRGELTLHVWDESGNETRLVTKGAGLADGGAHDIAIRLQDGKLSLGVDGVTSAEADFDGLVRSIGARDLNFGNPWGHANFEGNLTDFAISVAKPPMELPEAAFTMHAFDDGPGILSELGPEDADAGASRAAPAPDMLAELLAGDELQLDLVGGAGSTGPGSWGEAPQVSDPDLYALMNLDEAAPDMGANWWLPTGNTAFIEAWNQLISADRFDFRSPHDHDDVLSA